MVWTCQEDAERKVPKSCPQRYHLWQKKQRQTQENMGRLHMGRSKGNVTKPELRFSGDIQQGKAVYHAQADLVIGQDS